MGLSYLIMRKPQNYPLGSERRNVRNRFTPYKSLVGVGELVKSSPSWCIARYLSDIAAGCLNWLSFVPYVRFILSPVLLAVKLRDALLVREVSVIDRLVECGTSIPSTGN